MTSEPKHVSHSHGLYTLHQLLMLVQQNFEQHHAKSKTYFTWTTFCPKTEDTVGYIGTLLTNPTRGMGRHFGSLPRSIKLLSVQ